MPALPLPRALTEPVRLAGLPWRYTFLLAVLAMTSLLAGHFRLLSLAPLPFFLVLHRILRSVTARDPLALELALAHRPARLVAVAPRLAQAPATPLAPLEAPFP
jgi:hypothetical protein